MSTPSATDIITKTPGPWAEQLPRLRYQLEIACNEWDIAEIKVEELRCARTGVACFTREGKLDEADEVVQRATGEVEVKRRKVLELREEVRGFW
jgi:hypothetical protein